ncbi:MAG: NAD(P)-dependent oxidoreductase, partial [Candidatus Izemoplasmatales bacterium]|nr:NAD(P)-dependent oxidoreductase [Candidatus Izemoplasmatales bacterium]
MKVYVDKKMLGRNNYPKLIEQFNNIDFVDELDNNYDIEVMIIMNSTIKNLDFSKYHNLKWIQLLMAGYDNVDIESLKDKGILVSNARDIFSISIAEDIFSKILYFNRNTKHYLNSMISQTWNPKKKEPEIFNSTISIIGTGSIGQEVAKRMKSFGVKKIYGYKKQQVEVPFFDEIFTDESGLNFLIKEADYLILALPLTKETYHFIDAKKIALMKQSAVLINVARGNIVEQDALVKALKQKQIRGAGLDVTTPEPLPKDHE